jgi:SAM-dependent methyltransferase
MPHDSTTRFTNRVADYVKARPTYPTQIIDILREQIAFDATRIVADIGAGTGISSKLFLDAGNTVYAVEPNAAMREAAVAQLGKSSDYHAINGTAEATTLPADSIDLIVAAQAFHWFDRRAFAVECRRIGRADAHLLVMWNSRLTSGSEFAEGYEQLLLAQASGYTRVNHQGLTFEQISEAFAAPLKLIELPNEQVVDFDLLKARVASSSYVPPVGDPRHEPLMAELRRLFDRTASNGTVKIEYRTELYLGRVHPRIAA